MRGLVAGLLLVALLGATPAQGGVADQIGATFGLMVQDVVSAFPSIEGLVVAVDGDRVYLDLVQKDGVQVGQEFTLFRKGEVFRHPLTKQVLGRFEEVLGYAQVQRIQPAFAEAVLVPLEGRPAARPEDGARITRGRIRVAVPPAMDLTSARADLRRVPFMLALGLDQSRRFQSVDPSTVQELLLNQGTRTEELLVRREKVMSLGKSLEVAGWLVPVLIERRGVTYLDVTWISAVTGTPLFSRRLSLVRGQGSIDRRFPWEPVPED